MSVATQESPLLLATLESLVTLSTLPNVLFSVIFFKKKLKNIKTHKILLRLVVPYSIDKWGPVEDPGILCSLSDWKKGNLRSHFICIAVEQWGCRAPPLLS